MLKENKGYVFVTSLLTLVPMVAGIILWKQLPETVAIHFGVGNVENGWSSRTFAVFGIPLFVLAAHLFCAVTVQYDPRHRNISPQVYRLILLVPPLASMVCGVGIYGNALGMPLNIDMIGTLFMGFIFVAVGNYLPKCHRNYTVGIKLPWTLHDEENWNRTHRLAGWVMTVCGLIILIGAFVGVGVWLAVPVTAAILIPMVFSFVWYVTHRDQTDDTAE